MSGLLRNFIAFVAGCFAYGSRPASATTSVRLWVTPFDAGLQVLKSDRYLLFAETAQVDYLLRVGRFFAVLRSGARFVNVAVHVRFQRPVPMFSVVRVETRLLHTDGRHAWFAHVFVVVGEPAAEVWVKMKFKKGRLTVPPATFLDADFGAMPEPVRAWEAMLVAQG